MLGERQGNVADVPLTGRSRRKERGSAGAIIGFIFLLLILIAFAFYIYKAFTYKTKFFPNTFINEIDVSEKTSAQVDELIDSKSKQYSLHLKTRTGDFSVFGNDIGLKIEANGEVERLLKGQNIFTWPIHLMRKNEFDAATLAKIDDGKFEDVVNALEFLDSKKFVDAIPPKLSDYISGTGYIIEPEVNGTKLDIAKTKEYIKQAVMDLKDELNVEELGVYEGAVITVPMEELEARMNKLNVYVKSSVSYSKLPPLTGDTINTWLVKGEDGSVTLDESNITNYVKEVANAYNTVSKVRKFKTSYDGAIVDVPAGNYGWKINEAKEAEAIKQAISTGQNITREPEFDKQAASLSDEDYGNSYIEVNLTAQRMFLYKDGQKIMESDFVSGNVAKRHTTPAGIFGLTYKQRHAVLKGQDYAAPVDYWMPFNRNIGFHDAKWRSQFGGELYKTRGSHGCINMPPANAKILFENINAGFPVICYNLEGTARKGAGTTIKAVETRSTPGAETPATVESKQTETTKASETQKTETKATTAGPDNDINKTTAGPANGTTEDVYIVPARPKGN